MINLLPTERKAEIRAARVNVVVMRYLLFLVAGIGLVTFLLIATFFSLATAQRNANTRIEENKSQEASFAITKNEADQFRSDLAIAKAIIDNEVKYSALIYKISASLPSGVVLENLSVDSQTIGTNVVFSARARSTQAALDLKTAFQNNTDLFSNVYFQSISYNEGQAGYPYSTSLNATINPGVLE